MKSRLMLAPLILLILHLCFYRSYGIFRDEYYYFACGQHPAWGYVDHPPLVGWISFILSYVTQKDLSLFRFWSFAVAAAHLALVLQWVRLHRGGPLALLLVALALLLSPIRLAIDHFFSMNSLEPLIWFSMFWLFTRIDRLSPAGLVGLGILIGVGTLNKHMTAIYAALLSIGFFWDALERGRYAKRILIIAAIALFLIAPHILWQIEHGWPTLEFQQNARLYKNAPLSVPGLIAELVLHHQPLAALLWIPGLWLVLAKPRWRFLRGYGFAVLGFLITLLLGQGKTYYAQALIAPLLAIGAIEYERFIHRGRWIYPALLLISGILLMPLTLPVLPVETYQRLQQAIGFRPGGAERHEQGALPQQYADMFGWREMTEAVADAFRRLPAAEQPGTAIYVQNYGEAGAIDYWGPALGLPRASSGHNTYYYWGLHPEQPTQILIVGGQPEDHAKSCGSLQQLGTFDHPLRMPFERHLGLYLCRDLQAPAAELWPKTRFFI